MGVEHRSHCPLSPPSLPSEPTKSDSAIPPHYNDHSSIHLPSNYHPLKHIKRLNSPLSRVRTMITPLRPPRRFKIIKINQNLPPRDRQESTQRGEENILYVPKSVQFGRKREFISITIPKCKCLRSGTTYNISVRRGEIKAVLGNRRAKGEGEAARGVQHIIGVCTYSSILTSLNTLPRTQPRSPSQRHLSRALRPMR